MESENGTVAQQPAEPAPVPEPAPGVTLTPDEAFVVLQLLETPQVLGLLLTPELKRVSASVQQKCSAVRAAA